MFGIASRMKIQMRNAINHPDATIAPTAINPMDITSTLSIQLSQETVKHETLHHAHEFPAKGQSFTVFMMNFFH